MWGGDQVQATCSQFKILMFSNGSRGIRNISEKFQETQRILNNALLEWQKNIGSLGKSAHYWKRTLFNDVCADPG